MLGITCVFKVEKGLASTLLGLGKGSFLGLDIQPEKFVFKFVVFCFSSESSRVSEKLGNDYLFTKCLFTSLVPLTPPLPTSKVTDFTLNFYEKDPKQNCEHSPKIANKRSQNCEQTEYEQTGVSEKFWGSCLQSAEKSLLRFSATPSPETPVLAGSGCKIHATSWFANPPGMLQESLGPFGPEVSRECCWALECPKSVPRVSPQCLGHLLDL